MKRLRADWADLIVVLGAFVCGIGIFIWFGMGPMLAFSGTVMIVCGVVIALGAERSHGSKN